MAANLGRSSSSASVRGDDAPPIPELELEPHSDRFERGWAQPSKVGNMVKAHRVLTAAGVSRCAAIDFTAHRVLVFAWTGSGGDNLEVEARRGGTELAFSLRVGLTRDLLRHTRSFLLPRKMTWAFVTEDGEGSPGSNPPPRGGKGKGGGKGAGGPHYGSGRSPPARIEPKGPPGGAFAPARPAANPPTWAALLGTPGDTALATVKSEGVRLGVTQVVLVPPGSMVTADHRTDRVRIYVDEANNVVRPPRMG